MDPPELSTSSRLRPTAAGRAAAPSPSAAEEGGSDSEKRRPAAARGKKALLLASMVGLAVVVAGRLADSSGSSSSRTKELNTLATVAVASAAVGEDESASAEEISDIATAASGDEKSSSISKASVSKVTVGGSHNSAPTTIANPEASIGERTGAAAGTIDAISNNGPQDPRLLQRCIDVYGRRGNNTQSPAIWTAEDMIANRKERGYEFFDAHGGGRRQTDQLSLGVPYGRNLVARNGTVRYVEIPKTGSSTIKRLLVDNENRSEWPTIRDDSVASFAVAREPLRRFISGWGTIRNRRPELLRDMGIVVDGASEADNFGRYVDLVLETGDQTYRRAKEHPSEKNGWNVSAIWGHTHTQMWFLDLWERPIDVILRVENLDEDLKRFVREFHLKTNPDRKRSVPHLNRHDRRLDKEVLLHPSDVSKLVEGYLKQDYICLQYPFPDIHNVSLY